MADTGIYVTVREGGWAVKREGAERASKIHPTQREAIDHAREIVAAEGGWVMVQNKEGKFRRA